MMCNWKEEKQDKESRPKTDKVVILERIWMCIVGCTVGTFWGILVMLIYDSLR